MGYTNKKQSMTIFKQFTFDAAHFLPNVPQGHRCRQVHGHTYHLTIYVSGPVNTEDGWVIDFKELKAVVKPLVEQLDHVMLNEIQGLKNPTAENVARWFWQAIRPEIPGLSRIELKETPTSGVIYEGENK
jgi:6-pyruvoyltetrahydropterin/6-carboxytetrahydropterin synthase